MPNAKGKVTVGTTVDDGLRDRLDKRATEEGRSRAEVIERACLFYLEYAEVEKAAAAKVAKPKTAGKGK